MKHKKITAALSAVVAGAAVLGGIRYATGKIKPKEGQEPDVQEDGVTEGQVRECLLRLFRLYEDTEFDDLAEFLGDGSDPREYAADNYSGQLFPYIKKNMKNVMMMEGDDGTGKEPFDMTDVLFCYPACMIGCEIKELFSDRFVLCLENEIWMLEDGELASVHCVSIGKDGGRLTYRFVDTYIKSPGDILVCFDDLESGFTLIIKALESGLNPELP